MDNTTTNKSELLEKLFKDLEETAEIVHDLYYRSTSPKKELPDSEVLQGLSTVHEKLNKIQAKLNYDIACAKSHGSK